MRKAFDANVPKLKPRLKANGAAAATGEVPAPGDMAAGEGVVEQAAAPPAHAAVPGASPAAISSAVSNAVAAAAPVVTEPALPAAAPAPATQPAAAPAPAPAWTPAATPTSTPATTSIPAATAPAAAPAADLASGAGDVLARKDRLEKIKRKVADAARPAVRHAPPPSDPARAAESVLGLVNDLEVELVRAREREDALRADLEDAKRELGRTAADGRVAAERLAACEQELEQKRAVLAELLHEMQALEDERDESVRRAQALSALDEERARLLEEVTQRAEEESRLRQEREVEVERLSEELRAGAQDGARLRGAVGELARERDQLAQELERTSAERDDLAAAKRALEQVHAALAQARARLG